MKNEMKSLKIEPFAQLGVKEPFSPPFTIFAF